MSEAKRNPFFDIVKCVAILMVVMQHCFLYFDLGVFQHSMLNR